MALNITMHHLVVALKEAPAVGAEKNLSLCYSLWLILQDFTGSKAALNQVHINGLNQTVMDWLDATWKDWPDFSGDPTFPIAASHSEDSVSQAWLRNQSDKSFWVGEQGDYRHSLLQFLLEKANE